MFTKHGQLVRDNYTIIPEAQYLTFQPSFDLNFLFGAFNDARKQFIALRIEFCRVWLLMLLLIGGAYPGLMSMNRHLIFREAMRSTTLGHATGSFLCQTSVCFNRELNENRRRNDKRTNHFVNSVCFFHHQCLGN